MLTKKIGNNIEVDPEIDLLDVDDFKYAYTDQLFEELGVEVEDGISPIRGSDPWFINGSLHGFHVSATFNSHENLKLCVFETNISYKSDMKSTLNSFISEYRKGWHEHNKDKRPPEGSL